MSYMMPGSLVTIYPNFKKIPEAVVSNLVCMHQYCIKDCWEMQYLFLVQIQDKIIFWYKWNSQWIASGFGRKTKYKKPPNMQTKLSENCGYFNDWLFRTM